MIELEKYPPRYTQEMKIRLDIDRSARVSGRPGTPPFQRGRSVIIRLSLGKLSVDLFPTYNLTKDKHNMYLVYTQY